MLRVSDLVVAHGRAAPVVRQVSLDVAEREVVGVIGSNGAGKSTLVNAICGVLPSRAGTIELRGERIDRLPPDQRVSRGLVQVPEGRRLFADMTVEENLRMGAYLRPRREVRGDLDRLHDLFPVLADRRRQAAGRMSGGEQQMVAIARALMARPQLLILDEPTVGLAPKMVATVESMIALAAGAQDVAVILVEQNAELALEVTDRTYVIEQGKVTVTGASSELRSDPRVRASYLAV